MTRRLGLASLVVVVFAFAGAAAGPARPLQPLRVVVSVAWPLASEQVGHKAQQIAPPVARPSAHHGFARAPVRQPPSIPG